MTPAALQAFGSEIANVRLIGSENGTLPVTMRQAQSMLVLVRERSAPQQSPVGEPPVPVLPVK